MSYAIKNEKSLESGAKLRVIESDHYQDAGYPMYLAWYVVGLGVMISVFAF